MSGTNQPRNRKKRRAAGRDNADNADMSGIPLVNPSRGGPKHKTLFDIAAERQAELQGGQAFARSTSATAPKPEVITTQINPDGTLSFPEATVPQEELIGVLGQAVVFAVTLTMLHFTLDALVHQQYRQSIDWTMIFQRTTLTFPLLLVLVYMLHRHATKVWAQLLFLGIGTGAGCYLVYASNKEAYFAVMKRAPPLGTLWVWSVIEMRLEVALLSLSAVGAYFWWGGFTIL